MKQLGLLLLGCCLTTGLQAQSLAGRRAMDEKYGFRDVRFETDSTAIPGLQHAFDTGVRRFYARPTDNLHIGTGELRSIYYVFVQGKLAEVVLTMDGTSNANAVYGALTAEYGRPQFGIGGHDGYWVSSKEAMSYDKHVSGEVLVRISSRDMVKTIEQATKAAGKQAAKDL